MKFLFALSIGILLFSCSSMSQGQSKEKEVFERLAKAHVENGYFYGIMGGFYNEKTSQEEFYSYGSISGSFDLAPSTDNLYEIGSISKVFTGIILASMHLEGKVNIKDPVEKYLPELKGKPAGKITLVELSTHMSGLPRLPSNMNPANPLDPYADYTAELLMDYLKGIKKLNKPKEFSWGNYSNLGVGLLGFILTTYSKKTYDELLEKYITSPLSMADTSVNKADQKYYLSGFDASLNVTPHWYLPNTVEAAGGIKSNAKDMMTFLKANLYPKETPIANAILLAQKVHARKDDSNMIGLGWGIAIKDGKKALGHTGGTGGFSTNIQLDLVEKRGMFSLVNSANGIQCLGGLLMTKESCKPDFGVEIPETTINKYLGTYHNDQLKLDIILTKKFNQIFYEIPNQEKGRFRALSQTKFTIKGIAEVDFSAYPEGENFLFTQGPIKVVFKKVE